jgi:hypothetical protein
MTGCGEFIFPVAIIDVAAPELRQYRRVLLSASTHTACRLQCLVAGQLASFFSHFLRILTSIPRPYPLAHRMGRWTKQAGTDCLSQERFSDPLTEVLRDGARALLAVGPTP